MGDKWPKRSGSAKEQVAALIGAHPEEIIFTSCGTESDNTAIWSALQARPNKRSIVTTRVEHPAVLNTAKFWEKQGYRVTYLPVDRDGNLDMDAAAAAITEDTAIVSVMWANNETGVIFDVERLAEMAVEKGAIFHCDGVQAAGKIPIDMAKNSIHMLALSGHKLHAPKGIGILYVRKGTPYLPLIMGGHQEHGRRGGTENVPYIIGLGKAAELAVANLNDENTRVRALRDKLEKGLSGIHPQRVSERGQGAQASQHPERFLRIRGRRIHPAAHGQPGHLRFLRVGVHVRIPGAFARAPRHGRSLHGGARFGPVQPQRLQHGTGNRFRSGTPAGHHLPATRNIAVLEGLHQEKGVLVNAARPILGASTCWRSAQAESGDELLAYMEKLGLDSLEMEYRITTPQWNEMRPALKAGNFHVVSIHNYFPVPPDIPPDRASGDLFNLASSDSGERAKAVEYTIRTLETAHELEANRVVIHCGFIEEMDVLDREWRDRLEQGDERAQDRLRRSRESRKELAPRALDRLKFSLEKVSRRAEALHVSMGLENRDWLREMVGLEELEIIVEEFDGAPLGLWYDVGHAVRMEKYGLWKADEWLSRFETRIIGSHLHDVKGLRDHLAPGQGDLDFAALAPKLKTAGVWILEIGPDASESQARESVGLIRSLLKDLDRSSSPPSEQTT